MNGRWRISRHRFCERLVGAAGFELAVADEITDRHVAALDILGWKIVSQNDPARRWPFNGTMEGCTCPKWCDDINNPYPMLPEARRNHWDKGPVSSAAIPL